MFKKKGGGGSKAFLTMFKKTALLVADGFPNHVIVNDVAQDLCTYTHDDLCYSWNKTRHVEDVF